MPLKFDREKAKQKTALILDKIAKEADPQLLSEYRRLFKKEIPFFRRSWAAAYLLMLCDQGRGEASRVPPRNNTGERNFREADRPRTEGPRAILAEEESRRLFISIGRNRHLFPREILGLIITKAQVSREDIGSIRILDSYSFVQVRDTVADTIIEAHNGSMFRGRTLAVNYARSRREEGDDDTGGRAADETPIEQGVEDEVL
jgi:RNA recognition motif-containing protein